VQSQAPATKKGFLSPLVIGASALIGLFILGILGVGGAFMAGLIGPKKADTANVTNTNTTSPSPSASPNLGQKADLVTIPGGTFTMGRNDGSEIERPEHEVTVGNFSMDKTEVTNAEYSQFVQSTNYKDLPAHWVNGKPIAGQETMPVRFVSAADAEAFAQWRSKRDGVTYRLPTEAEWEYAARNGSKRNLSRLEKLP
jgi:formylglycine-generating enzyme required for sulfatase activity